MGTTRSAAFCLAILVGSAAASCSGDVDGGSGGSAGAENDAGAGTGDGGSSGPTTAGNAGKGGTRDAVGGEGGTRDAAGQPSVGGSAGHAGDTGEAGAPPVTGEGGAAGEPGCTAASDDMEVTKYGKSGLLLRGTVVTPTGVIDEGEVLIQGDTIVCADESCESAKGYESATVVATGGIIFPGLIDTANHVLFNVFDESDWSPSQVYEHHDEWAKEERYAALVAAKQYLNGEGKSPISLGCEMNKWGELKALMAGTTSIVGAADPADKNCYATVVRTIDQAPNGLGADKIEVASSFPGAKEASEVCARFEKATDAYLVHAGEGTNAAALAEFAELGSMTEPEGCLYSPKTAIVHGTAFGDDEFSMMAKAQMSLVWSPRSNVFLYGGGKDLTKTTNVPLALSKGINVALAAESPVLGGSQNLLDEMRFANLVDDTAWGDVLTAKDLADMVTMNAARVLGLQDSLGSIEVGKKADLVVIAGDRCAPYDSLLAATPATVRLTLVGGRVLYGDFGVEELGEIGDHTCGDALDPCGAVKFGCLFEPSPNVSDKFNQNYSTIMKILEEALFNYDELDLSEWDFLPLAPVYKCEQ